MSKEPEKQDFVTVSRPTSDPAPTVLEEKPQVEDYEILHRLADGGMGSVWRAVQISTHRLVALKVIHTVALHSERALARFEREVELAARLEHPNIARVYDSGVHHKSYYYAMELLDEGQHLDVYVQKEQLTQKQILELIHTICTAVQYAHQRGIIHRDLKPSNILITPDGQPHVLDFGLAKDLLEEQQDRTVSIDGDLMGTPAYMSPEQAAGDLDNVDVRTDVYTLGVILYQLLTDHFPYDVSGRLFEVLDNIQNTEPQRPRIIDTQINLDLEAVLLKSLEKEADKRYQSVADLSHDIQSYLQGCPIKARSLNVWSLAGKFILRHRVAATIMALLTVIILSTGFIGIYSYGQARSAHRELECRQQLYQQQSAEDYNIMSMAVFGLFLERWHDGNSQAQRIPHYQIPGSRNQLAMRFLLDTRPFDAKKQELPTELLSEDPSFWQFIFAEHHLEHQNKQKAIAAYNQCLQAQVNTEDETWHQRLTRIRLQKLSNQQE